MSLNDYFKEDSTRLSAVHALTRPSTAMVKVSGHELDIDYRSIQIADRLSHPISIIACCGWGSGWEGMVPWLYSLAWEGFHVYGLSLPGYGSSSDLPEELLDSEKVLRVHAETVNGFMATMGIEKAYLVGHSMAGVIMLHAAINEPEQVEKVLVLNPSSVEQYYSFGARFGLAWSFIMSGALLHLKYRWRKLLSRENDYLHSLVDWCKQQANPFSKARRRQRYQEFLALCEEDLVALSDELKIPLLYLAGGDDSVFDHSTPVRLLNRCYFGASTFTSQILSGIPHNPTLYHSEITAAAASQLLTM